MSDVKTTYNRSLFERMKFTNQIDTLKAKTFGEKKYIPILGFDTSATEDSKDIFSFKFDLKEAMSLGNANKPKLKKLEVKSPNISMFKMSSLFDKYSKFYMPLYMQYDNSKATYTKTKNPYFMDMVQFVVDKLEGGYSDHIYDKGGKTYRGVTTKTYNAFRRINKLPTQDVRRMSDTEMKEIYYMIFKACGADKIKDPRLAFYVFDIAVGSGPKAAKKILAKSGGNLERIEQLRRAKYQAIVKNDPTQKVFLKGWNNRVDKCRAFIDEQYPVAENIQPNEIIEPTHNKKLNPKEHNNNKEPNPQKGIKEPTDSIMKAEA